MPFYLGNTIINNGDGVKIGGTQVTKIMLGNTQVWVNNYIADAPTGFSATDGVYDKITFTWTLPADQGVPTCTYQVRDSGNVVRATAAAGATSVVWTTNAAVSSTYHVRAVNAAGISAKSNTNAGSSKHYNATWTGDSIAGSYRGIDTSSSSFRFRDVTYGNGAWRVAYSNGTLQAGTSSVVGFNSNKEGFTTTSSTMKYYSSIATASSSCSFSYTNGWSGTSAPQSDYGIFTSGGAIRFRVYTTYGAWIYLN